MAKQGVGVRVPDPPLGVALSESGHHERFKDTSADRMLLFTPSPGDN